jgi:hypothetical protein
MANLVAWLILLPTLFPACWARARGPAQQQEEAQEEEKQRRQRRLQL